MAIYRGPGGAGDATNDATSQAILAAASAVAAATSEANAAASAAAAATSATNAATSATASANSATASATSATEAANSAASSIGDVAAAEAAQAAASASASAAATSAANAATSESNASASATNAATSATNAANSATTATTQATLATNSATQAATSASTATTQASNAATSATNAANSATQSAASAASAAAITLGVASNRASIRPSLLLDFANTRQLDPRVTFARASTGKFYDGTSVVKAEENLLAYSQEFDNAVWSKTACSVTANSISAPDGTSTADTLTDNSTSGFHLCYQGKILDGNAVTFSVYAKKGTASYVYLRGYTTTAVQVWFDLNTGVVGTSHASITASIVSLGNGWYRCIGVFTPTLSGSNSNWSVGISTTDGVTSYVGSGSDIYIWGAQLEQRSTVTAYTPTTTSAITNYIPVMQTALANQPRFDVDPVTGESKGLLIEEQRTNLCTYSQDFSTTGWTMSNADTAISNNQTIAPDGTLTAASFLCTNTTDSAKRLYTSANITVSATTAYTFSVFVKPVNWTWIGIGLSAGTAFTETASLYRVNLSTGASTVQAGTSGSAIQVGNGWWKITATGTTGASTGYRPKIVLLDADESVINTAVGIPMAGVMVWGAQLEAGSFATSYIPTVASQVTRSADSASMTGVNFSSWYRQDEGSILVETIANNYATTGAQIRTFAMLSNDAETSYTYFGRGATVALRWTSVLNGVQQSMTPTGSAAAGTITVGQTDKFAYGYTSSIPSLVLNGTKFTDSTSPYSLPSGFTTMRIGCVASGSSLYQLNGTIKRIAYYPKRLSNTELQGITNNS